jgi:hypothetical protein
MHDSRQHVKQCFVPIGTLIDILAIEGPKNFARKEIVDAEINTRARGSNRTLRASAEPVDEGDPVAGAIDLLVAPRTS